jgi:uncharacterized protein YqeY
MSLLEKTQRDLVAAMKAKDEVQLAAIRMIKTALMKYKADQMKEADEQAEIQILNSLVKQRKESIMMFRQGGREELAVREEAELAVIEGYLPQAATAAEIEEAIVAALTETGANSPKQMGAVMKLAQAKLAGKRVDGKELSEKVKARLAG